MRTQFVCWTAEFLWQEGHAYMPQRQRSSRGDFACTAGCVCGLCGKTLCHSVDQRGWRQPMNELPGPWIRIALKLWCRMEKSVAGEELLISSVRTLQKHLMWNSPIVEGRQGLCGRRSCGCLHFQTNGCIGDGAQRWRWSGVASLSLLQSQVVRLYPFIRRMNSWRRLAAVAT